MNKQLQRALERLIAGNTVTAVEELRGFLRQVSDLTESGQLSQSEAEPLIRKARALIEKLEPKAPVG